MPQGGPQPGSGRPKGQKAVKTLQWEALGRYIAEDGAERYMKILSKLDEPSYLTRFENVLEYFKPKLARTEHSGIDGEKIQQSLTVEFIDGKNSNPPSVPAVIPTPEV